jgi:hypothetical protein
MVTLLLAVWLALAPQNTGTIQGTVKRAGVSDGIGGVDITLRSDTDRNRTLRTTSDAAGRFTFENIPHGKYTIQAAREGYFAYPEGQSLLTVESPQTQPIIIELVQGAVIGGRITDPQGRPLSGVAVSAMKLQYTEGRRSFGPGSVPQRTDDRGQYRLFWFAPGEYFIRAEYQNSQATLARRSYYPGTVDSNLAASFVIRGGESLDAMDFSLPAANSIRISGRVRIDGPAPASGSIRTFFLLPLDGRPTEQYPPEFPNTLPQQLGQTSNDFALEVRGLAPGSYDLAPFFLDAANGFHTGRTRIDIGDRDIENVTAYVSPDIEVTGRIALSGDSTPRNWSPFFLQLRARDATVPLTNRSGSATIAPDGTFSIRNVVEGRYQLYIGATPGTLSSDLYVSAIRQGGVDIRDEGTVDVRQYTPPIEITVSTGTGKIHGVAEGRAHVVLVPQLSRRKNVMFYDRVITDAKGEFHFEGIAPGEYKVFAFEQLPDTAEQNPEFIARYETLGQSVTVNSGATVETRVRVLR